MFLAHYDIMGNTVRKYLDISFRKHSTLKHFTGDDTPHSILLGAQANIPYFSECNKANTHIHVFNRWLEGTVFLQDIIFVHHGLKYNDFSECNGEAITEWHYHTGSILKDTQVHPAPRVAIKLPYSPQQVYHSGQHPTGPGCGRNGTCWLFQRAGEENTHKHTHTHTHRFQKITLHSPISLHFRGSKTFCKADEARGYFINH